ncbi:hypothetical protein [Streptosporangium sp. NPDC002721]|uniref:hypothetical protein n=1 Tax=Streptosporangium sp. NPDC002721 TaxID=3366188 RepID=UPI0036A40C5C
MTRLRKVAARTAAGAALGLAVLGTPAVSDAAVAAPTPAVSSAAAAPAPAVQPPDLCQTVKTIAGPLLSLVGAELMPLSTALNLIATLTGVPVTRILGCLV